VVEPRHAELLPRMLCAYLLGGLLPEERFAHTPHIAMCDGPAHLGCVAGWDLRGGGGPAVWPPLYHRGWPGAWYGGRWHRAPGDTRVLGTNPYTWRSGGAAVAEATAQAANAEPPPSGLNRGVCLAVVHDPDHVLVPALNMKAFSADAPAGYAPAKLLRLQPARAFPSSTTSAAPSHCLDVHIDASTGWLVAPHVPLDGGAHGRLKPYPDGRFRTRARPPSLSVSEHLHSGSSERALSYHGRYPDGRFHLHDFALFFYDIRHNVRQRLAAYAAASRFSFG